MMNAMLVSSRAPLNLWVSTFIFKIEYLGKCESCVESKTTKKSCKSIERESNLLSLIHSDLGDLKNTMTRGSKRFYMTFIDDYSRYTRVYLLRNKDEAKDAFIKY